VRSTGRQRPSKPTPNAPVENTAPTHAPISPARSAAFAILDRVATTSAHSDDLLHGPGMSALSQADRNLATTLVLGVLRWQIALDARMQPLLQRPDLALPSPVATALRMGAFQLQHLDRIPAHAALSESVELVRAAGHGHASGMVNAILRKLTRQPAPQQKLYETTALFAQRLAHPEWIVSRWVRTYGRTAAMAICAYDQQPPIQGHLFSADPTTTAHPKPKPEADNFEPLATVVYPEASASGLIAPQKEGVSTPALPHIDDGSRLVAELAAASHPAAARIWDCCAAPGGKTLILSHRHPASDILASDANPRRLHALAARLHTDAPHVRTLEADATKLPEDQGLFDLILCDVPCSGTGTLGRNPEIKQRLQPSDLARQATRQREILSAALTRLASGGHLLYSTCSLEPEENENVVADVLAALPPNTDITTTTLEPILNHLASTGILAAAAPTNLLRNGRLRTLPGVASPANGVASPTNSVAFQGDGFFAALFHRA
jgi:16S rRNA (cytosine967-C5)-methyltransferase